MQKKKCLTIDDLGLSESNLVKRIGDYGIYFKNRANDVDIDTELFRYLRLSHLMDLIDNRHLYVPNRKFFTDLGDKLGIKKRISKHSPSFQIDPVPSYNERRWMKQFEQKKNLFLDVCISCWTMDKRLNGSTDESFLMWKAYTDKELSCRIKTTIRKLINSIIELPCDMVISDVEYKDIESTNDNYIFQKSQYYDSEHEVRLVALVRNRDNVDIKIDPYELLMGVKTSPFLTPFVESSIINGLKRKYSKLKEIIEPSRVMEYPHIETI